MGSSVALKIAKHLSLTILMVFNGKDGRKVLTLLLAETTFQ